jgi:hypothetical protein
MSVHRNTGCPTRYRTRHFFTNSNINEDITTKFEQQYVLFFYISYTMTQVRIKFRCNILISGKIIKEMPGLVASGTPCIIPNYKQKMQRFLIYLFLQTLYRIQMVSPPIIRST